MEQRQTPRVGISVVAAMLSLLASPAKTEPTRTEMPHAVPAPQPGPISAQTPPATVNASVAAAASAGRASPAAPSQPAAHTRARHGVKGNLSITALAPLEPEPAPPSFILASKPPAAPASGFQPAPIPNPDATGPRGAAAAAGARLAPAFLTRKEEFLGNGFARASSADYAAYEKRNPAAGVSLLVPVVQ